MIKSNMGGITSLRILLVSAIASMRYFKGSTALTLVGGKQAWKPYFTYKTARVTSDPVEDSDVYSNSISWRMPGDKEPLLSDVYPYINKKCIAEVTFSNGTTKIYGTTDIPLVINIRPTPQSVPEDYNGLELFCSNIDHAPGRFGVIPG